MTFMGAKRFVFLCLLRHPGAVPSVVHHLSAHQVSYVSRCVNWHMRAEIVQPQELGRRLKFAFGINNTNVFPVHSILSRIDMFQLGFYKIRN